MKLKFCGLILLVFTSGVVASNNLGRLIPVNSSYVASWWKVGFACFVATMFGAFAWNTARAEWKPKSAGGE